MNMSNAHAMATALPVATPVAAKTRNMPLPQAAANEPTAAPAPRHSREPFETDGPATCLVWF
jgi:hypothetical protein